MTKLKVPHRHDSEVWGTTEYIALLKDPDGIVRAWGIGSTHGLAVTAAEQELVDYKEEKRANGDPLGRARFTCEVHPYCDSCAGPVHEHHDHPKGVGA